MYEIVTNGQLWLAILGSSLIATVFNKEGR